MGIAGRISTVRARDIGTISRGIVSSDATVLSVRLEETGLSEETALSGVMVLSEETALSEVVAAFGNGRSGKRVRIGRRRCWLRLLVFRSRLLMPCNLRAIDSVCFNARNRKLKRIDLPDELRKAE